MKHLLTGAAIALGCAFGSSASAQDELHPGENVYKTYCAACHDNSEQTRAPSPETMSAFTNERIYESLTEGLMRVSLKRRIGRTQWHARPNAPRRI